MVKSPNQVWCGERKADHGRPECIGEFVLFATQARDHSTGPVAKPRNKCMDKRFQSLSRRRMSGVQVKISCAATANIITATIRSSRRQVLGRASQGASQAAPRARVKNHSSEALAAPAT